MENFKIENEGPENNNTCIHELRVGSLCANCGQEVSDNSQLSPASHTTDTLLQTKEKARTIQKRKNKLLEKSKRMILILDLDQTILQTTNDPIKSDYSFELSPSRFYVKFRPHLSSFLRRVSKLFEIHVYTMGVREYAEIICRYLDPDHTLFGDRIVSRTENFNELKKKIDRITCISKNVVIVDDRADVWDYSRNLILIKPFYFFDYIDINDPKKIEKERQKIEKESNFDESPITAENDSQDETRFESDEIPSSHDLNTNPVLAIEEKKSSSIFNLNQSSEDFSDFSSSETDKVTLNSTNDSELKRVYKVLKSIHKKYFKKKASASKIARLRILKGKVVACPDYLQSIVLFAGGKLFLDENISPPNLSIESPKIAEKYGLVNLNSWWIYKSIYERKYLNVQKFILQNYDNTETICKELENEFLD